MLDKIKVGKPYIFFTFSRCYVGEVKTVREASIDLIKCSWVSDELRFYKSLKTETLDGFESYPPDRIVTLLLTSTTHFNDWSRELPTQKTLSEPLH